MAERGAAFSPMDFHVFCVLHLAHYERSLPHITYFFLYSFPKAEGSLEHSPMLVILLSAKLHHSTLRD